MTIQTSGPVFDDRDRAIIDKYCRKVEDVVGQEAVNRVHARLGEVLKHPTGYYESQIVTDRRVDDLSVNDSGVIYGPWLEGVGSRNFPKTRFRGYSTFRRVSQALDADAQGIAEAHLGPYLEELNA